MPKFVARDIWKTGTPPDEALSLVRHGTLNVDPDWRWQRGGWWTGLTSGNVRQAQQDNIDAVVSGMNKERKIYLDLVGTPGGAYDGWYFDLGANTWMAPDTSFTNVYGQPAGGGGTSQTSGPGSLPPGPTTGGANGTPTPKAQQAIEFSLDEGGDGIWVAKTPSASAAVKDGNPHPGISIINPGEWERITGGMSVREALSLDDYRDKGWKGLDKRFLAWNGSDGQPAGEELASAMDAAMSGDKGAYRALRAVGVSPPSDMTEGGGAGLFGNIGIKF